MKLADPPLSSSQRRPHKLTVRQGLTFSVGVLLICFLIAEVGIRAVFRVLHRPSKEAMLYAPDVELGQVHRPNARVVISWRDTPPHVVSFNRFGWRGPNPTDIRKAPGVFRILVIGESSTEDVFVGDGDTWPEVLQRELARHSPALKIEVINLGVSGYTSANGVRNLRRKGLILNPDLVVVYHGNNDLVNYLPAVPGIICEDAFYDYERRRTSTLERLLCRSIIVDRIQRYRYYSGTKARDYTFGYWRSPDKVELDLPKAADRTVAALDELLKLSEKHRFRVVLATQATLMDADHSEDEIPLLWEVLRYKYHGKPLAWGSYLAALRRIKNAQRAFARKSGWPCIEVDGKVPRDSRHFIDHIHSTVEGSACIGRIIANGLIRSGVLPRRQ